MKKAFSIIGMIAGLAIIVLGVLVLTGTFGGEGYSASSAPSKYDAGYATFGADFYTYVVNNAEEAASAVRTTANNVKEASTLLMNVSGISMIAFGMFMICSFGIKLAEEKEASRRVPVEPQGNIPIDELPEI